MDAVAVGGIGSGDVIRLTVIERSEVMLVVTAKPPKGVPQWFVSAIVDENGAVYLPACMAGNETLVLLMAQFDGVSPITHERHGFLPTTWLIREFPGIADDVIHIETRVRGRIQ